MPPPISERSSGKSQFLVDNIVAQLISSCSDERRSNDLHYLAGGLNTMIQGRIYPVLSGASSICLPDESYPLMALLYKSQYVDWHIRLQEKIARRKVELATSMYSNRHQIANNGFDHFGEVSFRFRDRIGSRATIDLIMLELISDLSGMRYSVTFNDTNCAYRSVILEEISMVIGRDCLFKRSLLLIKAWCMYELPRFCRVIPSAHDLRNSEFVTPLDVLIGFLREYSTFAWDRFALTPLGKISTDSIICADIMPSATVVSGTLASEFVDIFQKHRTSLHTDTYDDGSPSPPPTHNANANISGATSTSSSSPPNVISAAGLSPSHDATNPSTFQSQHESEIFSELKSSISSNHTIYILDGLIPMLNLAHGKYNRAQTYCVSNGDSRWTQMDSNLDVMKMIASDFHTGLTALQEKISIIDGHLSVEGKSGDHINLSVLDNLQPTSQNGIGTNIFPEIARKLDIWTIQDRLTAKCDSEPESFKHHNALLEGPKNILAHIISDAELLVRSKVTADAVAHTIVHLLEREGKSQTIGEIGKMLQEVVGNPNLTRIIKTNFRGLKRLIGLYPMLFRLGDEHSFNPHVHLVPGATSLSANISLNSTMDTDANHIQAPALLSNGNPSYPRSESSSVASGVSDRDYGGYGSNDDSEGISDDNTSGMGGYANIGTDGISSSVSLRVPNLGGSVSAMSLSMLDPGASEFTFTGSSMPNVHAHSPKQQAFSSQSNRGIIQPKMFLNGNANANIDAFAFHGSGDTLPQHYDDGMLDDLQLRSQSLSSDPYGSSSFMTAGGSQHISNGNLYSAGAASSVVALHRPVSAPLSSLPASVSGNSMVPTAGATLALTPNAISPRHSKGSVPGQSLLVPNPRMGHPGHPAINAAAASIALTKQSKSQGQKKEAKQVLLPINAAAVGNGATIVIPSPSNRELVGVSVTPPPYITAASGATIVDPSTGSKIYNPVKPEVWVPGKFAGASNPDLASPPLSAPNHSVGMAIGTSKIAPNTSPPPYNMGAGNSSMVGVGDFMGHGLVDGMSGPGFRMGYANNAPMEMPFGNHINGGGQFPHNTLSYGHGASIGDQNISQMSSLLSGHDELEMNMNMNNSETSVFGLGGMKAFDPTAQYGKMNHVSGHNPSHIPMNISMSMSANMNMNIPIGAPMMAGGPHDGVFNYSIAGRERGASGDAAWLPNFLRDL